MKNKIILIAAAALSVIGIALMLIGSATGGSPVRALANIGCYIGGQKEVPDYFERSKGKNIPNDKNNDNIYGYDDGYGNYGYGDSSIEDFFREFGFGDDFDSFFDDYYNDDHDDNKSIYY